ncbi:MAG: copper chaperone PCu(A)C [Pseudomonadota bacterium]
MKSRFAIIAGVSALALAACSDRSETEAEAEAAEAQAEAAQGAAEEASTETESLLDQASDAVSEAAADAAGAASETADSVGGVVSDAMGEATDAANSVLGQMDGEAQFRLTGAWVRTPPSGRDVTAAYLKIEGPEGVSLVSASSPSVERIELHTHIDDNGVMRMRPVEAIALDSGEAQLQPGGLHLMLYGLGEDVTENSAINIELVFDTGLETNAIFQVRSQAPAGE